MLSQRNCALPGPFAMHRLRGPGLRFTIADDAGRARFEVRNHPGCASTSPRGSMPGSRGAKGRRLRGSHAAPLASCAPALVLTGQMIGLDRMGYLAGPSWTDDETETSHLG